MSHESKGITSVSIPQGKMVTQQIKSRFSMAAFRGTREQLWVTIKQQNPAWYLWHAWKGVIPTVGLYCGIKASQLAELYPTGAPKPPDSVVIEFIILGAVAIGVAIKVFIDAAIFCDGLLDEIRKSAREGRVLNR